MWIWLATILLLGITPLSYSDDPDEKVDSSSTERKELEDVHKILEERIGSDWHEKAPVLRKKLKELDKKQKTVESESSEETEESIEKPWLDAQTNLKWKRAFHKIKHVAGRIIERAAASAAGKAIANAILASEIA
uniref:Hypothetical secreted protein n=1 Tax=Triatoma matogrossensis TaxID=162370 RepID=E2J7B5_9HEMI